MRGGRSSCFTKIALGRPDTGLTKTKALVERDKVDLLLSELVSSVGAAMAPYVNEQKIPWVSTVALASLTRAQKSPYIFRFVPSSYQFGLVAGQSTKKMGWKKAYFIGWNAPPSREAYAAVTKIFGEENVLEPMFPNVATSDYAPYLTKMDAQADGIFAAMWGSDSSRITQQYAEYGLNKKMPLFGIASFTSEEVLGNMPPESVGVLSAYTYCGTLDTPENKQFVDGYKARYNAVPGSYQYMGYMAAKMVIQALKDIKGRAEDRDAFIAALGKVQIKGPMGMASFDEHHGLVADFFPLTVEKRQRRAVGKPLRRAHRTGEGPLRYVPLGRFRVRALSSGNRSLLTREGSRSSPAVRRRAGSTVASSIPRPIRDMDKMTHRLRSPVREDGLYIN